MENTHTSFEILSAQGYSGHLFGLRLPCVAIVVRVSDFSAFDRDFADLAMHFEQNMRPLDEELAARIARQEGDDSARPVFTVGLLTSWILNVIGIPSAGTPRLFRVNGQNPEEAPVWRVYIPCLSPASASIAFNALSQAVASASGTSGPQFKEWLQKLSDDLAPYVPNGVNNREMIRAAMALGIPVLQRAGGLWQYGYGNKARIFSSSLTENTPSVGVATARSKTAANRFLKEAGIPVPRQKTISDKDALSAAIEDIGFPVVIKPADLDGGVGVSSGLETEAAVFSAFERARAQSENVIIEKCIEGCDYRINVFDGQVMLATQRVAANVVGDGISTVAKLVATVNLDPRRRPEKWFQMKPIVLDDEATELLEERGMTEESVPEKGQVVTLRRAANTSSGGELVPASDRIHPENATLAVRAAKALRLDLAGIDLITKDIARPWYEDNGAICEVNAQVQFGFSDPTQYTRVISEMVDGNGRIPIIVVLTTDARASFFHNVGEALKDLPSPTGFKTPQGTYEGTSPLVRQESGAFREIRSLLASTQIGSAVVVLTDDALVKTGLPFDRFDLLVVDLEPDELTSEMQHVFALCREHCAEGIVMRQGSEQFVDGTEGPGLRVIAWESDAFPANAARAISALFSQRT